MAKYRQITRLTRGVNGRVKRTAQIVLERRPVGQAYDAIAADECCSICGYLACADTCIADSPAQTFAGRIALAESMLADPYPQVVRDAVSLLSTGVRANVCACGEGHIGTCRRCFGSAPPSDRPLDELPPGWTADTDGYLAYERRVHASGACVQGGDGHGYWAYFLNADQSKSNGRCPSMLEAMAASLGFEIYLVKGDNWQGWCWKRTADDSCSCDRPYGDFETAELAVIDALAFDAGKRGAA